MRSTKLQDYVLANMVAGVAAQEARRLQVDRDDLEQEMTLWVLEHPDQLARFFGDGVQLDANCTVDQPDGAGWSRLDFTGEKKTAVALRNEARDYARRQRRQQGLPFDEEDEDD